MSPAAAASYDGSALAVQEERWRQRTAAPRPWLMNRSCVILASLGLGFMETFRRAPRIIRRLAFRAVVPLISFYEVPPPPPAIPICISLSPQHP